MRNDGDGAAEATTLRYYQSDDAAITPSDTELGTDAVAGESDTTNNCSGSVHGHGAAAVAPSAGGRAEPFLSEIVWVGLSTRSLGRSWCLVHRQGFHGICDTHHNRLSLNTIFNSLILLKITCV